MVQTKTDILKTKTNVNYRDSKSQNLWERLKNVLKRNLGLTAIIAAALLLEITSGVMGYINHVVIQDTMENLVDQEMNAIFYRIRNQLSKVEVTLNNMAWVVSDELAEADSMFVTTYRMVENNPAILGGTISFIPNYYPQKGYWFEPYAVRRTTPDGRVTIETIQLGSASHDYTKSEFFTVPIAQNCGHWSEPYLDADGAKAMVTTYGTPVHDRRGETVAVVDADLSLEWLDKVIAEEKTYQSTNRFLVTGSHNLLAGEDGPELQAALELLKTTGNKESYHKVKNEEGKKQHVFFQPVGGMTDWVLITVLDDSDVFGKLRKIRLMLYVLTGIGLLFLGFIVYRTSRNLENLRKVNAAKEGECRQGTDRLGAARGQQDPDEHATRTASAQRRGGCLRFADACPRGGRRLVRLLYPRREAVLLHWRCQRQGYALGHADVEHLFAVPIVRGPRRQSRTHHAGHQRGGLPQERHPHVRDSLHRCARPADGTSVLLQWRSAP